MVSMVTMLTAYGVRPMMFRLPAVATTPSAAYSSKRTNINPTIAVGSER